MKFRDGLMVKSGFSTVLYIDTAIRHWSRSCSRTTRLARPARAALCLMSSRSWSRRRRPRSPPRTTKSKCACASENALTFGT
jgi:hypothetical protein